MADKIKLGLDLGTKTLICANRNEENKIHFKQEINGFFALQRCDSFTKNMLISQKIPFIERDGKLIAVGSRAEKLAYAVNSTLRRPMAEGTVSKEQDAIDIMASIIQALLGKLDNDTVIYYCIPADAINKKTNVQFHDKVAKLIFSSYKRTQVKIDAFPINEARAIAIASEKPVAIAISWGAGMVNVCYTMFGVPIFEFSIVGSGDWIDVESAKQFGYDPDNPNAKSQETPTSICKRKHEIDLLSDVKKSSRVDQAILLHYQLLIENVIENIIRGFEENIDRARIEEPVPIVMAGGTASPQGFQAYFESIISSMKLPFDVSSIEVIDKPLYTVAQGCLMAAEMHEDS